MAACVRGSIALKRARHVGVCVYVADQRIGTDQMLMEMVYW